MVDDHNYYLSDMATENGTGEKRSLDEVSEWPLEGVERGG